MATTRHFDCFNACSIQASPAKRVERANSHFVSTVGGALSEAVKQYIEKQELYKRPKK